MLTRGISPHCPVPVISDQPCCEGPVAQQASQEYSIDRCEQVSPPKLCRKHEYREKGTRRSPETPPKTNVNVFTSPSEFDNDRKTPGEMLRQGSQNSRSEIWKPYLLSNMRTNSVHTNDDQQLTMVIARREPDVSTGRRKYSEVKRTKKGPASGGGRGRVHLTFEWSFLQVAPAMGIMPRSVAGHAASTPRTRAGSRFERGTFQPRQPRPRYAGGRNRTYSPCGRRSSVSICAPGATFRNACAGGGAVHIPARFLPPAPGCAVRMPDARRVADQVGAAVPGARPKLVPVF